MSPYTVQLIAERLSLLQARRAQVGAAVADWEMAQQCALPYGDPAAQDAIHNVSVAIAQLGETVLQIHLLADTEAEHVSRLLAFFDPPTNATILDAGCGIGGVAQHMRRERPDLDFILLNLSSAQLELCPDGFRKIHASFEDMPLPDGSVDAVMFNYSLGHGRIDRAFSEAARVLRPNGLIFIYDLSTEESARLVVTLGYKAYSVSYVCNTAQASGFALDRFITVEDADISAFLRKIPRADYDTIFSGMASTLYRFHDAKVTSCAAPAQS